MSISAYAKTKIAKVEGSGPQITDIEVVEHKDSYTSDTVLKAIENALKKGGNPSDGK